MITLQGITKNFGSFTAVDNISYTIDKGEYFALLGPNGAGKTTIVRMLMGFIQPSAGLITVNGTSATDPLSRKYIGYLPELLRIPGYLSGEAFLRRHALLSGMNIRAARRDVDRVLDIVSMKGSEKKRSSAYSKGMKQRIGLAAALLGNPAVLILDEPVSGLDPIGIRDVRVILERLRDTGVTVIVNSHLLSEAEKTCSSAGIMYKGKLLVKDRVQNIVKENETLEEVFIRSIETDRNE